MPETHFSSARHYQPAPHAADAPRAIARVFTTVRREYDALTTRAGLLDRSSRTWLTARGPDRKVWLHNLLTNHIEALQPGDGAYSFACDPKGRIQFDVNVLATDDALWLDLDAERRPFAHSYLDRLLIMEDVTLAQHDDRARVGIVGPDAARIAGALLETEAAAFSELAPLAHRPLPQASVAAMLARDRAGASTADERSSADSAAPVRLIRNDFLGAPGFELDLPADAAAHWWDYLVEAFELEPVGTEAAEALRIEQRVPAWGRDLDDQVLPAETGRQEQAVHFAKGCFSGHEIIERMRSRGSLARTLRRVELPADAVLSPPHALLEGEREVGRLTSAVQHPTCAKWVALGYVRTTVAPGAELTLRDSRGQAWRVKLESADATA